MVIHQYYTVFFNNMYPLINNSQAELNNMSSSQELEESGRGCRNKKKQSDPACCPVCSVTLRIAELKSHFDIELEKLSKICVANKCKRSPKQSPPGPSSSNDASSDSWETYKRVRANRQERLKLKSKKRKTEDVICPVCNMATTEDISLHVEMCLQNSSNEIIPSDEENIDVEGDDGKFEEYEWAGQTRVRASSLLEGGFTNTGIGTSISKPSAEEEDSYVVVDGDDDPIFGSPQYFESDLMDVSSGEDKVSSESDATSSEKQTCSNASQNECSFSTKKNTIVEVLKLRIRELEAKESDKESYKCLICMSRYKKPVVSICCWHVHCELCWMQTLAAKKLCPQCNMITSPKDLRRIYI